MLGSGGGRVELGRCSGVSDDVNNVPAATGSTETTAASGEADVPVAPVASVVPSVSTRAALWTTSEVIDGDTIRVLGPDGEQTVRLIGINAPERGECFYDEATSALQFSLGDRGLRLVTRCVRCRPVRPLVEVRRADRRHRRRRRPGRRWIRADRTTTSPTSAAATSTTNCSGGGSELALGLWAADACGAAGRARMCRSRSTASTTRRVTTT